MTTQLLHPNDPCLFFGYRNPNNNDTRDLYHTIAHWLASEQFRNSREDIRMQVIECGSPKEAKKLASRNKEFIRKDWLQIRSSVLRAGLLMAADQNPFVLDIMSKFCNLTLLEISCDLQDGQMIAGYKMNWYAPIFWDVSEAITNQRKHLAFLSSKEFSLTDKKIQLGKTVRLDEITQVLIPITKELSTIGEALAINHRLPVRYYIPERGRFGSSLAKEIVNAADQLIVFERKGAKLFDPLIVAAKQANKSLKLTLI